MSQPSPSGATWSSRLSFHLVAIGAAVGLGSIWRFPYLAGTGGGSAFILVFVLACVLIAVPLLVAEFVLGRRSGRSPPEAAGAVAVAVGLTSRWNVIGLLGTLAAFLIFSYYSVIAGWVLAYAWKCAAGVLAAAGAANVTQVWRAFLSDPVEVGAWHLAFVVLVVVISARGLQQGIEVANKVRAPALLALLLILVAYALVTGDADRGLAFAFKPNFAAMNAQVVLAAIGQTFYATGVGQAMMMAYGAYAAPDTSLVRTALLIAASILLVSLLATLMVFSLVFGYGMNPAQGPELVFDVLPRVFVEIPAGRLIGTLFFLLLVLAALMPSVALLEPSVAWLVQRRVSRRRAVVMLAVAAWIPGVSSVLSFNVWSHWRPLSMIPALADKTFFDVMDYVCSNVLLPLGALLVSLFVGWRVSAVYSQEGFAESTPVLRAACTGLLRYVCPLAILAVFIAQLL